MPKQSEELADIDFERKVHETEKAWLLLINGERKWIPKLIAEVDFGDKVVTVPVDWAVENGLV